MITPVNVMLSFYETHGGLVSGGFVAHRTFREGMATIAKVSDIRLMGLMPGVRILRSAWHNDQRRYNLLTKGIRDPRVKAVLVATAINHSLSYQVVTDLERWWPGNWAGIAWGIDEGTPVYDLTIGDLELIKQAYGKEQGVLP
jgi:hypothetical protein